MRTWKSAFRWSGGDGNDHVDDDDDGNKENMIKNHINTGDAVASQDT